MKSLIVTADDFGLSTEVNQAVAAAHRDGILTAASLMVGAPACSEALEIARSTPTLRVGLHLALVEARPVLPPDQIPDLVDASGQLSSDLAATGAAIFFRSRVRRQLEAEIAAQFEAYRQTGLPLDHVNAHKHYHLHPTVATIVLAAARRHGLFAVRVPNEPSPTIRAVEPRARSITERVAVPWTALLKRRVRQSGCRTADQTFGLAWSGGMTPPRLQALLTRLPDGVTEIYTHPATAGGFLGAAPGYQYAEEFAALIAPATRAAAEASGARLCGFSDLA